MILDNIGLTSSAINLAIGDNATVSAADGEILVALKTGPQRADVGLRAPAAAASCRRSSPA